MNYNSELEYSIIGTLFTSYKESIKYFDKIVPENFYNKMNQLTLSKAKECYVNREDFTGFTAMENLKSNSYTDRAATDYVLKCTEIVSTIYELNNNLKILQDLYKKREMENILNAGLDSKEDFNTNLDMTIQSLYDLRKLNSGKKKMKPISAVALEYLDFLGNIDDGNRVDTGFPLIDSMLKGMFKGQLIGVAARPGVGKTALALSIGLNVAKKGKTVAMFSQEMEAYEIYERLLSNQSYVKMDNLIEKLNNIDEKDKDVLYNKIINKSNDLSKLPIGIADITKLTVADIRTECQKLKNLGLVIIDYLQLMTPTKREQNRNLEIGQITRELKILSSELGCAILLLSQLNRTKDETDKPSLNDLRDSGSIEQDLVKSMMMWNLDVEGHKVGLTINKNRRGSMGDVELSFNGNYMMYTEIGLHKEEKKRKKSVNWNEM